MMNLGYIQSLKQNAINIRLKKAVENDKSKTKASGLFIINNEGKLLLAHPTNHSPNFWSIPKGRIEEGETAIEAAIRETMEETNVDFSEVYKDGELTYYNNGLQIYKKKSKSLQSFIIRENCNTVDFSKLDLKCDSTFEDKNGVMIQEMDNFKWVTLSEALELVHSTQVEVIKELIKK